MWLAFVLGCVHVSATDTPTAPVVTPACPQGKSTLDGVCIGFPATDARFTQAEAASGVSIPYTITVTRAVTIDARAQDAGHCGRPGPSGLIVMEDLSGTGGSYGIRDTGLCAGGAHISKLVPGSYEGTFHWDGRSWAGPSDTGNPKGPPFPPGRYTLDVSAVGTVGGQAFEVVGSLPVTITR
jgi:hypothetical protein